MNNKITAVALCLAMVCTFVLIDASDEAEAVEQTIVEVSSGEELAEAMKNRYDLTNYQGEGGYISTVTASPVTIVFTQDITLDDDSGFSSRYSGEWEVTPYFTGTIDGRGHSLITNFSKDTHYLAESTLGDVVVKDINIICEGHTFSFFYRSGVAANVYVDQPVNVSFEDITVERFPDVGNN